MPRTETTRAQYRREGLRYASDLTYAGRSPAADIGDIAISRGLRHKRASAAAGADAGVAQG
jgi:hypothetical protein